MDSVLDILLAGTARNVQKDAPEKEYRVVRLTKEKGRDVIFRLRALPYSRCAELEGAPDVDLMVALDGIVEPSLKDVRLAAQYGLLEKGEPWGTHGITPIALLQAMLLPGEIRAISRAVQRLSGYDAVTLKEVKKN